MEEEREEFKHTSVLLSETIEFLNVKPDGIYVDGTLGGAGHALAVVQRLTRGGRLIGIDQDEAAIRAAGERLGEYAGQVSAVRDNYRNMPQILKELGIERVDGILLDLGVSSYQFDTGERGFSYRYDAPLDMRMDRRQELTAAYVVNHYDGKTLYHILRDYGEEPFAQNIAKHIIKKRQEHTINTTLELAEVIKGAIPMRVRKMTGHPAKRTFQALRIYVNGELSVLEASLEAMIRLLKPGGRLCIITFHSLEDRIVKSSFRQYEHPCTCPPDFPICICGKKSLGRVVLRKPITASPKEQEDNPRSRSAKLRVFERGRNGLEKEGERNGEKGI